MKAERPKKTVRKSTPARAARSAARTKIAKAGITKPKSASKKAPLKIPPILLEGDTPPASPVSGPGQRYALGPTSPAEPAAAAVAGGELPEAYGTQRLLLTARDPHWLYAHWDLTRQQLNRYNALSRDGHLVLRVYRDAIKDDPFMEIHVHPESRNWFVNVGVGGATFLAELGYYARDDRWVSISTSCATLTPPDTMSEDFSVWFETLPVDLQFDQLLRLVKSAAGVHVPLVEAIQQLRLTGYPGLPDAESLSTKQWTSEQERALAELLSMDAVRRVWMGSLEITELLRRHLQQEISSAAAAQFAQPGLWSGVLGSISSPFGAAEMPKAFWFNVNAELIIYGATEPNAQVTIGGRPIKLRPDGTFSYRFALPDGKYNLSAVATSADNTDGRAADLSFARNTQYQGDVGKHPQDPNLKPPGAENVA